MTPQFLESSSFLNILLIFLFSTAHAISNFQKRQSLAMATLIPRMLGRFSALLPYYPEICSAHSGHSFDSESTRCHSVYLAHPLIPLGAQGINVVPKGGVAGARSRTHMGFPIRVQVGPMSRSRFDMAT